MDKPPKTKKGTPEELRTRYKKTKEENVLPDNELSILEQGNENKGVKTKNPLENSNKDQEDAEGKKVEIKKTIDENEELKINKNIEEKLKINGLAEEDFKSIPEWKNLSFGEKFLIAEQASQEVLSKVREIGEKRFQEKNKIDFTKNISKWRPVSVLKKIGRNIGKAYYISKEEKEAIKEAEEGKLKPDQKTLGSLVSRIQDMHLNIEEKGGKAVIQFIEEDKNLSKEQIEAIKEYNKSANNFARMPDSWKNEKAARNNDKSFWAKNHKKFKLEKSLFEKAKSDLIESKVADYEKSGMKKDDAIARAILEINSLDYRVETLQLTNTNPDALNELSNIKKELSSGRLLNSENIWRGIYIGSGYIARSITTSTYGLLAAPLVSGIIGGFRGKRKADLEINKAFFKGFEAETFRERKEKGKNGLFDSRNLLSKIVSEGEVNAKQVGAFVDADSQILRINNLTEKIDSEKNLSKKASLINQLSARLEYVEQKHEEGLINYGTKNAIATNYNLLKLVSGSTIKYALEKPDSFLNKEEANKLSKENKDRTRLLDYVLSKNKKHFEKNELEIKIREISRGIVMGATFSSLGIKLREWMPHVNFNLESIKKLMPQVLPNLGNVENYFNNLVGNGDLHSGNIDAISGADTLTKNVLENGINGPFIPHNGVEVVVGKGQGAISAIKELQNTLKLEYASDLDSAPASVKHIIETGADKLAQEYGMYNPTSDSESALIQLNSKFSVDGSGNVKFDNTILEKGDELKASGLYQGKMFDSDLSGIKTLNEIINKIPEQNINHIFPGDKMSIWESVKNSPVSTILNLGKVKPEHQELVEYLKKLEQVSGIKPLDTEWGGKESISNFINRALHETRIKGLDKLKEVTLDEQTFKDYTNNELAGFDKKMDSYQVSPYKINGYDHVVPNINQIETEPQEIPNPFDTLSLENKMDMLNVDRINFENIKEVRKLLREYDQTPGGMTKREFLNFIKNNEINTMITSTETSPIPNDMGDKMRYEVIARNIALHNLKYIENLSRLKDENMFVLQRQIFSKELPNGKIKIFIVDLIKEKSVIPNQVGVSPDAFEETPPPGVMNDDGDLIRPRAIPNTTNNMDNGNTPNNVNNSSPENNSENIVSKQINPEIGNDPFSQIKEENINHLFAKNIEVWDKVKNSITAESLLRLNSTEGGITDTFKPLASYAERLHEISGIEPNKSELFIDYQNRVLPILTENTGRLNDLIIQNDLRPGEVLPVLSQETPSMTGGETGGLENSSPTETPVENIGVEQNVVEPQTEPIILENENIPTEQTNQDEGFEQPRIIEDENPQENPAGRPIPKAENNPQFKLDPNTGGASYIRIKENLFPSGSQKSAFLWRDLQNTKMMNSFENNPGGKEYRELNTLIHELEEAQKISPEQALENSKGLKVNEYLVKLLKPMETDNRLKEVDDILKKIIRARKNN